MRRLIKRQKKNWGENNMEVKIPYGKNEYVPVDIPEKNLIGVFDVEEKEKIKDTAGAVKKALENPVKADSLKKIAEGRKNVVIAITDHSRPNIEKIALPIIVEMLNEAGLENDDITVMIGPGSHRPAYEEEVKDKLGSVYGKVNYVCHSAFDSEMVDLGETSFGHPVKINKQFYEADLKIALGTVLPHPFAGFSGGGKMVSVGVASDETISSTHRPVIVDNPQASFGIVEDNPFYLSSLEMAEMAEVDFLINGVMNEEEELFYVQAGKVEEAHRDIVAYVREMFEVKVPEKADVLVVASGYPKDSNLYHVSAMGVCAVAGSAVKYPCVDKGARLIMVSPMEDGIYNHVFYDTLAKYESPEEVVNVVGAFEEFEPGHHRAYGVAQVLSDHEVVMAQSYLEKDVFEKIHMSYADTAQKAVDQALADFGEDARIAVMQYSHRMIVKYDPEVK
ncbi:MAG: nickel-dependent lactate racemase [Bacillota bacterium]